MSLKKLFSCIFAIIILSISVLPCFAASPALSLGVSSYQVNAGDIITVTVNLSADSGLGTLDFNVKFNPEEFEYVAGSGVTNSIFEMEEFYSAAAPGTLKFVGVSTGVVTKGGALVSMKFKSIKTGGTISLVVNDATDENDAFVSVRKSSVTLSCAHAKMKWTEETKASCVSKGMEVGECPCGYTTTRETAKTTHTYTSSTIEKEATCTQTGIEVGTCTVCGESGAKSVIPAKGHDYTDWTVTKEPTADSMGVKERFCRTCSDKQTQMISQLNEGEEPEESTSDEESSTEPTTLYEPFTQNQWPTDSYFEIETETTTQANGIFGNAIGSDKAVIVVIILAVLVFAVLIAYMVLIIRQKKK